MARAPFQVLVLPFRETDDGTIEYALFRRKDMDFWQGIAGGGEDEETPLAAARREASEEAGIGPGVPIYLLKTLSSVPVYHFSESVNWSKELYVIPQVCFAIDVGDDELKISEEHSAFKWASFEEAMELLHWESNQTALWELNERLLNDHMVEIV
jgi:dATP pyrophosphohydrolase